jgi:ubiquinone/menaquinone biosynthesis C-methylase UbiE
VLSDSAYLINQWNSARLNHPFFGENLSDEEIDRIWDSSAETYGDGVLSVLHDEITAYLVSEQYLKNSSSVLDIGCGPGTYSLRFSQTVKK